MRKASWITTFGTTSISIMLSLVTSVLLARYLGPEGRGALLAIIFWPTMFLQIFNFSLNEATIIHVAQAAGTGVG
jgi:O-antigen/teichoic acid export membrane protein